MPRRLLNLLTISSLRHRLFNLLTIFSLLLCVASAAAWWRSLGHLAWLSWVRPELEVQVSETDGVLGFIAARDSGTSGPMGERSFGWFAERTPAQPGRDRSTYTTPTFNRWGFGFHLARTVGRPGGNWSIGGRRLWIIYVPNWLPVTLFAIAPAASLTRRIRRGRRSSAGLCPQ